MTESHLWVTEWGGKMAAEPFETPMSEGEAGAADPDGPLLAEGKLGGARAYENLREIHITGGTVTRPSRRICRWRPFGGRCWGGYRTEGGQTYNVAFHSRGDWGLKEEESSFLRDTVQVQVYRGAGTIVWYEKRKRFWQRNGPLKETYFGGRATIRYKPEVGADIDGLLDEINLNGFVGIDPDFDPELTITFKAKSPAREEFQTTVYTLLDICLRGNIS